MKLISEKSTLKGEVLIPTSKSHTIRAVIIAGLARGKSIIHHPLESGDALAAVRAARLFGARIDLGPSWTVEGVSGFPQVPENVIDVANSGTTMNLCMGTASLTVERSGGGGLFDAGQRPAARRGQGSSPGG
jgi:3-phosphoshikimate 1-carboxyvinyltransferase